MSANLKPRLPPCQHPSILRLGWGCSPRTAVNQRESRSARDVHAHDRSDLAAEARPSSWALDEAASRIVSSTYRVEPGAIPHCRESPSRTPYLLARTLRCKALGRPIPSATLSPNRSLHDLPGRLHHWKVLHDGVVTLLLHDRGSFAQRHDRGCRSRESVGPG